MTVTCMPSESENPYELYHRKPCRVNDWLMVCGDLDPTDLMAQRQLAEWVELGVTAIVDCREEWSDREFVAQYAPGVDYIHVGTHDNGGGQSDEWFDAGVGAAREILEADPNATVMVHCHMGINRGPSMAFAMLIDSGVDSVEALDAIRGARPIAAIDYAGSAVRWHLGRQDADIEAVNDELHRVFEWMSANEIDVRTIIRRIRQGSLDASVEARENGLTPRTRTRPTDE